MKKNMGNADRIVRILIAAIIVVLYSVHVISGTTALILLAIAGVFVLTSLIRVCPLYLPFKISTTKKN